MKIFVRGTISSYEFENLTRLFFPAAQIGKGKIGVQNTEEIQKKQDCVLVHLNKNGKAAVGFRHNGTVKLTRFTVKTPQNAEYELCRKLYDFFCAYMQKRPSWGMLTGVRPVRLIHAARARGESEEQIRHKFCDDFDVSEPKFQLTLQTANSQQAVVNSVQPQDYSLYVSIPFCPSRCSYCSFVSRTIENSRDLVQPYVDALCRELEFISRQAQTLGLRLRTVYIGGGTPTSLSAVQLRTVMQCIQNYFPLQQAEEYTVEAGRPDCTDEEKLRVIKELGADRISINPQTFQDSVLRQIGRKHTARDILDCFDTARRVGHTNINMDLIAGLPSDTVQGFEQTLQQVLLLRPENVTVHTLTLKRASNLVIEDRAEDYADVARMVDTCALLPQAGYTPYYLYRQKGTLQNLENTGFCLPGREGLYNIYIMEELHTIFSAGAGGVTKLKGGDGTKLERIFNFKYPLEYVRDFDAILKKKQGVDAFYASQMDT